LMSVPPRYGILSLTGRRMLAATTRLGVPVHVWTIDDPAAAARLWAGGVTGIVTNDPGGLIPVRDAGRRTP